MSSAGIEARLQHAVSVGIDQLMDGCAILDSHAHVSQLIDDRKNAVLMYHSIGGTDNMPGNLSVDRFRRHIAYLTDAFDVVDLPRVLETEPPTKQVALTFDDGFKNFYTKALPVLRAYEVPATVFITSAFIDDANWDLITSRYQLADTQSDVMLTTPQIQELTADELITIGNHTRTHPKLPAITDPNRLIREIEGARKDLEAQFDVRIDRFAYTYGPFDEASVAAVRNSHALAVTGQSRLISPDVDRYRIPRINAALSKRRLRWQVTELCETLEKTLTSSAKSVQRNLFD